MKEKILQQLKNACGQNTVTTEITLNKWVDYLTAKITDESQIDAEIGLIKPLIETYDGNMNFVAAKAVKDAKATPPPADPPSPPDPNAEPAWVTTWKAEQAQKLTDMEQKLTGFQKEKSVEAMVTEAKKMFFKKFKISDAERPLCEKALAVELKINQHENAEALITGWKTQYEDFRSASGLGGIDPAGNNDGGGAKTKPILANLKQNLQREGKLPTPQTV
jgi:hypothetical protein